MKLIVQNINVMKKSVLDGMELWFGHLTVNQRVGLASRSGHLISKIHHHHNKHQVLGHLARSVSTVTAALSSVSSVSQLFSFLVDCSGMVLKGFGVVAFFAFC
jgi:hypothetical protein